MLTTATKANPDSIPGLISTFFALNDVVDSTLLAAFDRSKKTIANLQNEISALPAEAAKLAEKSFDNFINEIDKIHNAVSLQSTPSSQAPATTWFSQESSSKTKDLSATLDR